MKLIVNRIFAFPRLELFRREVRADTTSLMVLLEAQGRRMVVGTGQPAQNLWLEHKSRITGLGMKRGQISWTRTITRLFNLSSTIPLFYSATSNDKTWKTVNPEKDADNFFALVGMFKIPKTKLNKNCNLWFFLKTAWWNILMQTFNEFSTIFEIFTVKNWWLKCKKFHRSQFWSDLISRQFHNLKCQGIWYRVFLQFYSFPDYRMKF